MSQIDTSAVERYLTCPICRHFLKDAKLLPCGHPFCRECLHKLYVNRRNYTNECACPVCRKNFVLDYSGVDCLPSFFQAQGILSERSIDNVPNNICEHCKKRPIFSSCKTCRKDICRKCVERHKEYAELKEHEIVALTRSHPVKQNIRVLTSDRKKPLSQEEYDRLRKMKNELAEMQIQMEYITKTLTNGKIRLGEERDRSKSEIKKYAKSMKEKVEEEEKKMIDQLSYEYKSEQDRHSQEISKLESMTKDVKNLIGNIMPKLYDEPEAPDGPDVENICRAFDKILCYRSRFIGLEKEKEIFFLPYIQSTKSFRLGEIKLRTMENAPTPHQRSFSNAIYDLPHPKYLHPSPRTLPRRKEPRPSPLQSLPGKTSAEHVLKDNGLDAQALPCVPTSVKRQQSFSTGKGKISGISITSDSNIFVVNSTTKQCLHYKRSGSCVGKYEGTLKDPLDVAAVCTDDGYHVVYVTDHGQRSNGIKVARIRDGRNSSFALLTTDPLEPMGITVTMSKLPKRLEILICDASDRLIKVYSDTGELLRKIGQKYFTLFQWPLYLAIFNEKYILVTDHCLQTLFIIDMEKGDMAARIKHENFSPSKVCVLPDGSILIGDNSHQVAHKTTPNILSERRKNREIDSTISFPSEPIAVAANSDYLCVGCKDGNIHIIPLTDNTTPCPRAEGQECFV